MKLTIKVTADDIKKGQKFCRVNHDNKRTTGCAIARAFQRATGDSEAYWMFASGHSQLGSFNASRSKFVDKWVENHDAKKKVKPFNFIATSL